MRIQREPYRPKENNGFVLIKLAQIIPYQNPNCFRYFTAKKMKNCMNYDTVRFLLKSKTERNRITAKFQYDKIRYGPYRSERKLSVRSAESFNKRIMV